LRINGIRARPSAGAGSVAAIKQQNLENTMTSTPKPPRARWWTARTRRGKGD